MTKWAKSLIRLSTYEVETLQKRLAEVVTRRTHAEMKLATLDAEYELECVNAAANPMFGGNLVSYKHGYRIRRDAQQGDLDLIQREEEGVRDQLSYAFEDLKKFEHVAELSQLRRLATEKKVEDAAMDEVALRLSRAQG